MSFLVTDPDSGISVRYIACEDCDGQGFEEVEVLDDEVINADCVKCKGTGLLELAF